MSLDQVINAFGNRILRPSHYEVFIDFNGVGAWGSGGWGGSPGNASGEITPTEFIPESGLLSLYAETVAFPGRQTLSKSNTTHGAAREIAYESAFSGEIAITFRYTADMPGSAAGIRRLFDYWMDSISDPVSGQVNYYDNYTTNMEIGLQDPSTGTYPLVIQIEEVYPKSISDMELSHASSDSYLTNTVSFAYRSYKYLRADRVV